MNRSIVRCVVVLAAASLILAGCAAGSEGTGQPSGGQDSAAPTAGGWDAVTAGADEEGSITVYSSAAPETNDALAAAFKKDYPDIELNVLRVTSVEIQQRTEAERAGNAVSADVMLSTDGAWHAAKAEQGDFFAPLIGPNATEGVGAERELLSGDDQVLLVAAAPLGYAWNSQENTGDLTLDDMFDPKFKGMLGALDFTTSDVFVLQYYLFAQNYGGDDFLRKLAAQNPRFYPTNVPMAQAMGAGEVSVTVQMTNAAIGDLPLTMKFMDGATIASPFYASVSSAAPHPDGGQVFVDWLLSQSAQEVYAEVDGVSMAGIVPSAPVKVENVKLIERGDYDQKFIDDYRAHLSEIFQR